MNCKDCPHKVTYHKGFNTTREVFCDHPNQDYIREYLKEHRMFRMTGFIGFIDSKGKFPLKTAPKWCPLKDKGGE